MSKPKIIQRDGDPFMGLTVRAANCMARAKLHNREEVLAAIKSKRLHPDNLGSKRSARPCCLNYGWKTHKEVHRWLGLTEPLQRKKDHQQLQWFELRMRMEEVLGMDQLPAASVCWNMMVRMDLVDLPEHVLAVKLNGKWFIPADGFSGKTEESAALEKQWEKLKD